MIELPTFILRLNAGFVVIHIQSLARDLMYSICPAFFTGWLFPYHVGLLAEDLTSQV